MVQIEFSSSLFDEVISDPLECAGHLGELIRGSVDWRESKYALLEVGGVDASRYSGPFNEHAIPHLGGYGTFVAPSNDLELAKRIIDDQFSLVAIDFMLEKPHPAMRQEGWTQLDGLIFYVFDSSHSDRAKLLQVIRHSKSWTFLGFSMDATRLSSLLDARQTSSFLGAEKIYFGVFSGDSYLEVEPKWIDGSPNLGRDG